MSKTVKKHTGDAILVSSIGSASAGAAVPRLTLYRDSAGGLFVRTYVPLSDAEANELMLLSYNREVDLREEPLPEEDFRQAEMAWLLSHRQELAEQHAGQWIALDGPRLVAHAFDVPTLMRMAAEAGSQNPFITAIPAAGAPRLFVG